MKIAALLLFGAFTADAAMAGAKCKPQDLSSFSETGSGSEQEFLELLEKNDVEYDERYIWD